MTQGDFEERVVQIKRVSKKTKGGNSIGFTALVLSGNKTGSIGLGLGKAHDVASAIKKGMSAARRNVVGVTIIDGTIPHDVENKFKASVIFMKPAPKGSGIIAGGAVRDVLELAGIRDISAKLLKSNNKSSTIQCAIGALQRLRRR